MLRQLEFFPKIVRANRESQIGIRIPPDVELRPEKLRLYYVSGRGLLLDQTLPGLMMNGGFSAKESYSPVTSFELDVNGGMLYVRLLFAGEGEHTITLDWNGNTGERFRDKVRIYSLAEDLFLLHPWRGDMHLHSIPGRGAVIPVAQFGVAARRQGLDFMAISDHKYYLSSIEAMMYFDGLLDDFKAYPGEEVHLHDLHNLHICSFGASHGISEELRHCDRQFRSWVEVRARELESREGGPLLRYLMAASDWVFDRIRSAGGVSFLNHPYWAPADRRFLPEPVLEYILEQRKFDAIEVMGLGAVGPFVREANMLALSRWQHHCILQQRLIPVVGNTDAHLPSGVGANCTIVFAPKNDLDSLKHAIRNGFSVASEQNHEEYPHLFGDYRLVKYSYYLLREFYPGHDEICRCEADLLEQYGQNQNRSIRESLAQCGKRMQSYIDRFRTGKDGGVLC